MTINRTFYDFDDTLTVLQLADIVGGTIVPSNGANPSNLIKDIAPFHSAAVGALSYVSNDTHLTSHNIPDNAILLAPESCRELLPDTVNLIIVENPRLAFASAARHLVKQRTIPENHLTASAIASTARIDPTAKISPRATIMDNVVIGANTTIEAGAVIYPHVSIGANCRILANSSIAFAEIGDNVVIRNGVVIGSAGFGFEPGSDGIAKVPQLGITQIGDGCDIGSNSTVDRGSLNDTVLGKMVMIDNLCHIAHNCSIGDNCMIAAQVGMAGSVTLGKKVIIGGQAGISGHLTIGDEAIIMGHSGVTKNVDAKTTVVGFPAEASGDYWRKLAGLRRLLKQSDNKK
ncbi:UDP-3-O-(3-hydroxymyristoyl)glucosamine N-acyltransferase [Candidatus Puniceispirillum sp.]|uniref:UDP-3-O-(3-hydroxymyristoyl)glucosamine N-acyltransferase n=1 Tax=Candidatus Puniceispirillum sp. TaxID=2026719 RepID=UPI001ECF0D00|nr:UDP-3-O-(3-hydroxymyristoyl)glucosamine N-acyltransferase [Candidatus Puniceispirillum sp.]MBT6566945.1 UDP-3-O-(3-hydroxymyristoyl)glucosamine N-acyltransferase [Candidatus Puniceispirillum sp.]